MSTATHHKSHQLVKNFETRALRKRPIYIKFTDSLTVLFGTTGFFILNILVFIFWILANSGKIPGINIFDPFPYFFLTTGISIEAIVLAILVLISENRQNQTNTIRSELQLQVNLIAEREITMALRLLKRIADSNKVKIDDPELVEMLKDTDTSYIERKLEEQLVEKPVSILKEVAKPIEAEVKKIYDK